jgi:hypothetical protein
MPDIDNLSDRLMGELLSDDVDVLMVVKFSIDPPDEAIERVMRKMDREIDMANGRPSNHHGSNPRRSK